MPITQDRMLRVLESAEEYERGYKSLFDMVTHYCKMNPENLAEQLLLQLKVIGDYRYPAVKIIAEERMWYNHSHSNNTRRAKRLRAQRAHARAEGELNTTPRTTTTYPSLNQMKQITKETNEDLEDFSITPPKPDQGEEYHPDYIRWKEDQNKKG